MQKEFYTLEEIAQILNVSYMTIYRWVQKGILRAYQIGKQYRVDAGSLRSFIESGETLKLNNVASSLSKFIGSGMVDYAYMESRKFAIDLSLGVNPLGCSKIVKQYSKEIEIDFTKYSEVVSQSLRKKIGMVYNFDKDDVLLGAGASDLLHLCYTTFLNPLEEVVLPETTFPPFEFLAMLTHGHPKYIPMKEDLDLNYEVIPRVITHRTKMMVLCNPNNPTGRQLDINEVENLIGSYGNIMFVIDEANIDFGGESFLKLVNKYDNLLILRSFSKGFGLAGLRIGFVVGNKDLIYAMKRRQTPFAVNIFAQKYAEKALDDMAFLEETKKYALSERLFLEKELTELGYKFAKSDSNYLLVDVTTKFHNSEDALRKLNEKEANAVNGDDFRGLNGKYLRLSPRLHEINEAFIEILKGL